jgi:hypothetical protein
MFRQRSWFFRRFQCFHETNILNIDMVVTFGEAFNSCLNFLNLHSGGGGGIKIHSTLLPLNGLLCQPRVIMIKEKSVE